MKQQDIAIIIVIVFIAAGFSFGFTQLLFSKSGSKKLSAEKVEPIKAEFITPDKAYFNDQSVNPTQLIQIGDGNNAKPF